MERVETAVGVTPAAGVVNLEKSLQVVKEVGLPVTPPN